ncbi:MAG: hypothetical protein CSA62_12010 [Planctomycetota bacterium]|nr:MAG: hypothetical protein CSA62_12010 [Planctomycetota bacterium]
MSIAPIATVVGLLLLSSCASHIRDWRQAEYGGLSFEDLWAISQDAMTRGMGFRVDAGETDRGKRILVSRWRVRHHGFKPSERVRLRIEILAGEEDEAAFLLRYYAEREIVDDPAKRLHPEEEDWGAGGQDRSCEEIFDYQMRSRIAMHKGEGVPSLEGTRPEDPMNRLIGK